MKSRTMARAAAVLVAGLATACSDAPTAMRMAPADVSSAVIPVNPAPKVGVAEIEYFEVCKYYRGGAGPSVTVDVVITGQNNASFPVTIPANGCKDIWLDGGANDYVAVTEQVPAGYTSSYVKEVATRTSYTIDPEVAGNSTSGTVSGNPGEGVVVKFYNTLIPPPPPPPDGCSLTQGYWKNHEEDWDDAGDNKPFLVTDMFYNSGVSYLTIMKTPPKGGNAYLQLAHQFIAASLNVNGLVSSTPGVTAALQGADAFFTNAPAGMPNPTGATKAQVQAWASLLASYNEGNIGPGHCD